MVNYRSALRHAVALKSKRLSFNAWIDEACETCFK